MRKRNNSYYAAALLLLCIFHGSDAVADQFSFRCSLPGFDRYLTFDDMKKRVVAYNFLNGSVPGMISVGTIKGLSAEEIQFDLAVSYQQNLKIGDFTLNRKDGSVTLSHDGSKVPCHQTPLRPVLDLWQLLED